MSSLILNAGTSSPIIIPCQRLGKGANRYVGSKSDSANGAERSSIRGQKRVIPVLVSYVDTATEASIQAAIYNGVQVPCSGDILQNIQTLCSIECVSSDLVPGLVGFYVMQLMIYEVNASTVLLKYAASDTITGEAFTRSTAAYQTNVSGVLESKAINVKRDGHYIGGVRTTLLEGARTNIALWCRDLSNAAWVKTSMTAALTSVGADGVASSATRLTATAGNATVSQAVVLGSSARFMSAYVKRITGVGAIQMTTDAGGTWTTVTVTASYSLLSIPTQTLANPNFGFRIVTNGDAIDVDFVQNENGAFGSSPIATTTVAATRGADTYSLPSTTPPQEMSVYMKFVELGSIALNVKAFEISDAFGATPHFFIVSQTALYDAHHSNGVASVDSQLAAAPASGNTEELVARLFSDGSIDLTQSINAGAATAGAQSVALALPSAWSGLLAWLNSGGTAGAAGFMGLQSFKIVAGARSLTEMRAA